MIGVALAWLARRGWAVSALASGIGVAALGLWLHGLDVRAIRAGYEAERTAATLEARRQETVLRAHIRAVDEARTRELADAQVKIDHLAADVAAGRVRLRMSAKCPGPGAGANSRLGDGAAARPDDAAKFNYFVLRKRIALITAQVRLLQDAVRAAVDK